MFWYIVGYIVLTCLAIWFGKEKGIFESEGVEFFTRTFFLLTVGWLVALLVGVGEILDGVGRHLEEQTMGVRLRQTSRHFVIPWAVRWSGRQLKKLIPQRKKKEEAK